MIDEQTIAYECANKTFARARNVAKNGASIYNRKCDYEPSHIKLHACVESSSWSDWPYDVTVSISDDEQKIVDYECTCPAHDRYPGMCKHAAGLLLLYNQHPDTFKGYERNSKLRTSGSISEFMKRMSARKALAQTGLDRGMHGLINLDPKLEPGHNGHWWVSFKICSPTASYVVKDVQTLLEDVNNREYREYGKRLGFTHDIEAFTPNAQKVLEWLMSTTASKDGWWGNKGFQNVSGKRYLEFTQSQTIGFLDLYAGQLMRIQLPEGDQPGKELKLPVRDENPHINLVIKRETGGYILERDTGFTFLCFRKRIYALSSIGIFKCDEQFAEAADFLQNVYENGEHRLLISEDDMPTFCSCVLPMLEQCFCLDSPAELQDLKPVECAFNFYLDCDNNGAQCKCSARYGADEYPLWDLTQPADKPKRDVAAEDAARCTVKRYLPEKFDESTAVTVTDDDMARLLFYGVEELKRYGDVYCTDAFQSKRSKKRPAIRAGLSVRSNLLNLTVTSDDLDAAEITALLESYQANKSYHKLKDGSFIDLEEQSEEDLEKLAVINALAAELGLDINEMSLKGADLDSYHAFLLDSVIKENEKDAAFKEFVARFDSAGGADCEAPAALAGTLRPYQTEGFKWLHLLHDMNLSGILADEMGLGKSLQVITLLESCSAELDEHPALIVCPASLVYNWKAEFEKFAPDAQVCVLAGSKPERAETLEHAHCSVYVCSYDTLRSDIENFNGLEFSFQVIDEAQYIKNHATKAAKAVKSVTAAHKIALTGTPIENRLSELWSIFDYLMPGLLGPYARFKERYESPITSGDAECAKRLSAKVGPFILRRLKKDVLTDLPDKLESVVHAKLTGEQRMLYDAHEQKLRQSIASEGDAEFSQGKIAVLAELTKLRQICCDPRLLYSNYNAQSAKLETLCELVQTAVDNGEKVLVFSQFTSYLSLIAAELDNNGWSHYSITGSTPKKKRVELVDAFNQDDTPVFLISLKAGGTGLNLVGASVVIHADPWWNAAAQSQATDRAHRIGQTRDVSVYKIIADDTIEERIVDLQESKIDLANAVLSADGASLGSLSKDELIDLLTRN